GEALSGDVVVELGALEVEAVEVARMVLDDHAPDDAGRRGVDEEEHPRVAGLGADRAELEDVTAPVELGGVAQAEAEVAVEAGLAGQKAESRREIVAHRAARVLPGTAVDAGLVEGQHLAVADDDLPVAHEVLEAQLAGPRDGQHAARMGGATVDVVVVRLREGRADGGGLVVE